MPAVDDYDFYVITDNKISPQLLNEKRRLLEKLCGIRHIDFAVLRKSTIYRLPFTMANFDLVKASKQIYGNFNIEKFAPDWKMSKLPKSEGIVPLYLYLSSLIIAYPDKTNFNKDKSFLGYQQLTKSILGWSTAMLIMDGRYHPLYSERNKFFQQFYSHQPNLCKLVHEATNFKLEPSFKDFSYSDYYELWHVCNNAHLSCMKEFLQRYYNIGYECDWNAVIKKHDRSLKVITKRFLSQILRKHHYFDCYNSDLANLYFCLSEEKKDAHFANKVPYHLRKIHWKKSENNLAQDRHTTLRALIAFNKNASKYTERGDRIYYDVDYEI